MLGVVILAIIIAIPFIINETYKYGLKSENPYITMWGAEDVLSFYGSVLAFLGTVSLGALALWQNFSFNKLNQKQNRLSIRPYISTYIEDENISLIAENDIGYFSLEAQKDGSLKCTGFSRNRPFKTRAYIKAKKEYEQLLTKEDQDVNKQIELLDKQATELNTLNNKYILIQYKLTNNGNASAVKIDITLNKEKITPLFALDKGISHILYLFCDCENIAINQTTKFDFDICFFDIEDYGPYKQSETFYVTKKEGGLLSLNYKEQISSPNDTKQQEEK